MQLLPFTVDGEIQLEHHKLWVEQRRSWEALQSPPFDDDKDSIRCIVPGPHDVLHGRDNVAKSHTGNIRFHYMIANHQEEYDKALTKDERSIIAASIVLSVKKAGGRFLKPDKASWVQVSDEVARNKVTNAFRNCRMKATTNSKDVSRGGEGANSTCTKRKPDCSEFTT